MLNVLIVAGQPDSGTLVGLLANNLTTRTSRSPA